MDTTPFWRHHIAAIVIGLLNVFAIGLGMGVPIFAIGLGFPVGWWFATRPGAGPIARATLLQLVLAAAGLAGSSLVVLAVVWGPQVPNAFDPAFDAAAFGIPLILYGSQASMIGWLVLMMLVSPVLQFLAMVTAGTVGLVARPSDED
ncbi:MAG: hypothetical protein U1E08_09680 [Coriobacteriia bacterium]|nr:hypothetical protein [Coriobacteriia bacterium]